jgi:acyl phosphate:glycerol-3-phosphate acyltransferase
VHPELATALLFLAPLLGAYLIGSIPFGLLLTRMFGIGDIRAIGSGNIGATNVLRTGRRGLALATLLLDGAKGALAVLLARKLGHAYAMQFAWEYIAAIGAVLGHVFPIWLRFKGGKGVATALGVYLALSPPLGLVAAVVWLAVAGLSRTSSVGGIGLALAGPAYAIFEGRQTLGLATALIAAIVVARHRDNIRRLVAGTEPKIGATKNR